MEWIFCLIPIGWTLLMLWIGYLLGKRGSPIRWVGWGRD